MSKKKTPNTDVDDMIADAEQTMIEEAVSEDEDRLAALTQEELVTECIQAQQLAAENWDKVVRVQAEMENVRRRAERDVVSAHKYGSEKLIKDLLPVVDSLESGLEIASEGGVETQSMREGMELTLKMLLEALEKSGVKQIDPMGEPFNPEEMEAVSMQPAPEVESNTVLVVIQKGYLLNDRLVRAAKVMVSQ